MTSYLWPHIEIVISGTARNILKNFQKALTDRCRPGKRSWLLQTDKEVLSFFL